MLRVQGDLRRSQKKTARSGTLAMPSINSLNRPMALGETVVSLQASAGPGRI
jgi:hypothetical protein